MFQDIISLATDPSFDVVDNLIRIYHDQEDPQHAVAVSIYNSIVKTYYEGIDVPELEHDAFLLNVQQRAGIILNMFTSNLLRRDDYSEENITPTKSEEEAPKNE